MDVVYCKRKVLNNATTCCTLLYDWSTRNERTKNGFPKRALEQDLSLGKMKKNTQKVDKTTCCTLARDKHCKEFKNI